MKRNLLVLLILVLVAMPVAAWSAGMVLGSVRVEFNGRHPALSGKLMVDDANEAILVDCFNPSPNDKGNEEDAHIVKTLEFTEDYSSVDANDDTMIFLDDASICGGSEWQIQEVRTGDSGNVNFTIMIWETNDPAKTVVSVCFGTLKDLEDLNGNSKVRCH